MSITVNFVKSGKIAGTVQTTLAAHGEFSDLFKFSCDQLSLGEEERAKLCIVSANWGFVLNKLLNMTKLLDHLGIYSYL
jgi:hypothetical protein